MTMPTSIGRMRCRRLSLRTSRRQWGEFKAFRSPRALPCLHFSGQFLPDGGGWLDLKIPFVKNSTKCTEHGLEARGTSLRMRRHAYPYRYVLEYQETESSLRGVFDSAPAG